MADHAAFVPRLLDRGSDAPRLWQVEGTMVLVDISGFTTLSEQLARRGRAGTEDLVSTLTRIFTLLLAATDDGGDVVKFAGDALLIHYEGLDHEVRACHAAFHMQRMLGLVGNVELSGARARLRMSVGVATGRFDMLLSGTDQLSHIVTGEAITRLMLLQDAANAGEILVDEATAAALPASVLAPGHDGGALLRRSPRAVGSGVLLRPRKTDPARIDSFLPKVFAERPDLLESGSDHRWAAMAFVLVGWGNPKLDGDLLGRVDRVTAAVEAACNENGVTLLDTDMAKAGYRYFLTAGAPVAAEDAEGRLARALLQILDTQTPFTLSAGLTSGRVFSGAVGPAFRQTYTVMGDTTNLAARLTAKAPPGRLLAQRLAAERSLTVLETAYLDPIAVKGKAEPIQVALVNGVVGRKGRSMTSTYVGREAERDQVVAALGARVPVQVFGEAGLGKSRLAAEAIGKTGLPSVAVAVDPFVAAVPYQTLRMLLRPLLGLRPGDGGAASGARLGEVVAAGDPDLLPWLPLLAPAVRADVPSTRQVDLLDERFRADRFHAALADLLRVLLPEPTVVLVDDAQWCDQTSADALLAVVQADAAPWRLVTTHRGTDAGLRLDELASQATLTLAPLDRTAAARLAALAAGRPLLPAQVDAIVDRADGNPFFLLELAVDLTDDGELPGSIEELVAARIDGLDSLDRDALRQAAVIGSTVNPALFRAVTGDDLVASLPSLDHFLRPDADGTAVFTRELYREVAYTQLPVRRRRDLHARTAAAIAAEPALSRAPLAALSGHSFEAGLWPQAFEASVAAGDRARANHAPEGAVTFYNRALVAGQRADVPAAALRGVHESLGLASLRAGHLTDARREFLRAARAGSPEVVVRNLHRAAEAAKDQGDYRGSLRLLARARQRVSDSGGAAELLAARLQLVEIGVRSLQGRWEAARDLSDELLRATGALDGDPEFDFARAHAMYLRDSAAVNVGGPEAVVYGDQPGEVFARLGEPSYESSVSNTLGLAAYWAGDWTGAAAHYLDAKAAGERAGAAVVAAFAAANAGELLVLQGRHDDAVEAIEDAQRTFVAARHGFGMAFCRGQLGIVALHSGSLDKAQTLLEEALADFTGLGMAYQAAEQESRLIEAALTSAPDESASGHLRAVPTDTIGRAREFLGRVEADSGLRLLLPRARRFVAAALADAGEAAASSTALQGSVEAARELGLDYELALALAAQGRQGDPSATAAADRIFDNLGVLPAGRAVR